MQALPHAFSINYDSASKRLTYDFSEVAILYSKAIAARKLRCGGHTKNTIDGCSNREGDDSELFFPASSTIVVDDITFLDSEVYGNQTGRLRFVELYHIFYM